MTAAQPTPSVPEIRRPGFEFGEDIPSWWYGGDRVLTRNIDALHMLFPEGEAFFIRSVRHFTTQLDDPQLKARVRGFIGQEVMHGREHEAAFTMLERDGIEYQSFLDGPAAKNFRWMDEHLSPLSRLAITCALEHMTATLGEGAFTDPLIGDAHPTMQALMLWHAAEEVEHKSVAFDVYKAVGGGYVRRILAMVAAYASLMILWNMGTKHLLKQDGGYSASEMRALKARMEARGANRLEDLKPAILDYLRPSFHPDDNDTAHLAAEYFAGLKAA